MHQWCAVAGHMNLVTWTSTDAIIHETVFKCCRHKKSPWRFELGCSMSFWSIVIESGPQVAELGVGLSVSKVRSFEMQYQTLICPPSWRNQSYTYTTALVVETRTSVSRGTEMEICCNEHNWSLFDALQLLRLIKVYYIQDLHQQKQCFDGCSNCAALQVSWTAWKHTDRWLWRRELISDSTININVAEVFITPNS